MVRSVANTSGRTITNSIGCAMVAIAAEAGR